jgi:hypothetical protein
VNATSGYCAEFVEAAQDVGQIGYAQFDFDFALRTYFCGHGSV